MFLSAVMAMSVTLTGTPAAQGATTGAIPGGGFGGYRYWPTSVRSVEATWQVPVVLEGSPDGNASTWIGAQNDRGGYPFIQVGTVEEAFFGLHASFAFWSDTTVGFHPQIMFGPIHGGDTVAVDMQRHGGTWHLSVDDLTSQKILATNVSYGAGAAFTQAEWLQEDPVPDAPGTTNLIAGSDSPYPKLSNARFTQVLLNGHAPVLELGNGQTLMATGGVFRVPTVFDGDAFGLLPPVGLGRRT